MYGEELVFTPKYVKGERNGRRRRLRKSLSRQAKRKAFRPTQRVVLGRRTAPGGGVFMDLGCHGIAFCYWFLDRSPIKSIYCQMGTYVHAAKTLAEDDSLCIMEFANGAVAMIENSWARRGGMDDRIEVFGGRGRNLRQPAHGQRAAHLQRKRLRIRRGESPDHQRVDLPGLRGALELRHPARDDPFCPLRSRQGNSAGHGRRWIGRDARSLCGIRVRRRRKKDRASLPGSRRKKAHRFMAEWPSPAGPIVMRFPNPPTGAH